MELESYTVLPSERRSNLGIGGWELTMLAQALPARNQARRLSLRLLQRSGASAISTLEAGFSLPGDWTLCPGIVRLTTSLDGVWEYFVCGGHLTVTAEQVGELRCRLSSSAPVLHLRDEYETMADQLAEEMDFRLVEARTAAADPAELDARLAGLDPMIVYSALLRDILDHYDRVPDLRRVFHDFYLSARREAKAVWGSVERQPLPGRDWQSLTRR